MAVIEERVVRVDGVRTFYRQVAGEGTPTVFVHGNPTHSEDWLPFLERIEGPALALDMPGWGFSEHPRELDYSMEGLAAFVDRYLDALEVGDHNLVVHDWGGLALIGAQRHPDRVRRLVVVDAVALLPGYRWHWIARWFWRVPGAGELFNLTASKAAFRSLSRQASPRPGPLPEPFIDMVWAGWRRSTHREMLELYRSGDPERLAAAGERLGDVRSPALVVWGRDDPYIPVSFGRDYAERLPNAELLEIDGAGHWPWVDRPDVIDSVLDFLAISGG